MSRRKKTQLSGGGELSVSHEASGSRRWVEQAGWGWSCSEHHTECLECGSVRESLLSGPYEFHLESPGFGAESDVGTLD